MALLLPPQTEGLALALAIGLLMGVERGWRMQEEQSGRRVAGIRSFAILGLTGGLAGIGLATNPLLAAVPMIGAVAALLLGYGVDMRRDNHVSATSTLAGVLTLGLGAMATTGNMALASVGAGSATILLGSRDPLHRAIRTAGERDIKALLRLVLAIFVILPLLPDQGMGPYAALNPYRLWIVVVVTGSISFTGYCLVRWLGERRGSLLTAGLGALVSSTAVTVDGARRLHEGAGGWASHAAVAIASTIMLARSLLLVAVVAPTAFQSFSVLVWPGLVVSSLASALLLYLARKSPATTDIAALKPPGLRLALLFAVSVAVLAVASAWAQARWGGGSGATLIAIGGLVDIDAAIAAVGALPVGTLSSAVAALALAAPTLFNTLFKLVLFITIAGRRQSLAAGIALGTTALALGVPIMAALL
ncbi:MAG: MgtC/SapB family protein [Sphingomonas sp.]